MTTIQIFDPPMCCSSGVCGPAVDPVLVAFAANLRGLISRGVRVERFSLSQQPQAFAASDVVKAALAAEGNACLPLVLVDGVVVSRGVYPDGKQLAALAGLGGQAEDMGSEQKPVSLPVISG